MRLAVVIEDQSGHTLLETVVSMALFVSVLIPLGAAAGKLMLTDNSDMLYHALRIAESEICMVIPQNEMSGRSNTIHDRFVVQKAVSIDGNLTLVEVSVALAKKPEKSLVTLQKAFLAYR